MAQWLECQPMRKGLWVQFLIKGMSCRFTFWACMGGNLVHINASLSLTLPLPSLPPSLSLQK